jgi:hypothetical protein
LNFTALKIEFEIEGEDVTIEIPIKNGYLWGNKNPEQVIYIDGYLNSK